MRSVLFTNCGVSKSSVGENLAHVGFSIHMSTSSSASVRACSGASDPRSSCIEEGGGGKGYAEARLYISTTQSHGRTAYAHDRLRANTTHGVESTCLCAFEDACSRACHTLSRSTHLHSIESGRHARARGDIRMSSPCAPIDVLRTSS